MPHNRTRIWVGLAIIAVTIPAVGQYYYGSPTNDETGRNLSVSASDAASDSLDRDYQSEVYGVLARSGAKTVRVIPERSSPATIDERRSGAAPVTLVPPAQTVVPAVADADQGEDVAVVDESPAPTRSLSDDTVYGLVVESLPEDQQEDFERAWVLMTPEERASTLDEFRANLQPTR